MDKQFIAMVQKLITEQGKDALLTEGKSCLEDYTGTDYKKERRLLAQALEAGVAKAIDCAGDLEACKKQQVRMLHEEYALVKEIAVDVVNTLAFVLRGDTAKTAAAETECAKTTEAKEAEALMKSGERHRDNGNTDLAIADFSRAIQLDTTIARCYNIRGDVYFEQDKYDLAIADYSTAIQLDKNNATYYANRGDTYILKGEYNLAIADFSKAIQLTENGANHASDSGDGVQTI